MKTCPNCGQSTRDDDRFCPSCGQPTDPRRQGPLVTEDRSPRRQAASAAASNVVGYVGALKRFWWVLVIGLLFAIFASLSARFTVGFFPPSLEEKEPVSYTAEARLLVNSASNLHYRAQVTTDIPRETGGGDESDSEDGHGALRQRAGPWHDHPEREHVSVHHRVRPHRRLPARGIRRAPRRSLRPGRDVGGDRESRRALGNPGHSSSSRRRQPRGRDCARGQDGEGVHRLAPAGADRRQDQARGPHGHRAAHDPPAASAASAGPSTTLPILVFVVVFAAFCVLAILLDRLVPARPQPARSDVEPLEQPVKVKKTA